MVPPAIVQTNIAMLEFFVEYSYVSVEMGRGSMDPRPISTYTSENF